MRKYILFLLILFVAAFLRLYKLADNPPSLYWDEASLGYNAYAILTTGHDEHGESYPLARFIAFGDYKAPGYIYAAVPALAIFGINEFAVRFPSAISGILMVFLTYILASKLTGDKRVGIAAAGLLAFSPWSLQLSRAAFEANLAAFFNLAGITALLGGRKRKWLLPVAAVFFMLSFYTFNANRILAPLFILWLTAIFWQDFRKAKRWLIFSGIVALVLLWPSLPYLEDRESRARFQEVSIFTDLKIVAEANARIARNGNAIWAKILFNRRVLFAREFLNHYVDHFRGDFLFITGDRNPRLSTQDVGEMYLFEAPFLLLGLLKLLRERNKTTALLFGWLLFAPIPAATARETPHMLRIASILPTFQVFTGLGIVEVWKWLKNKNNLMRRVGVSAFTLVAAVSLFYYLHNYWVHYPVDWSGQWQYGYKQLVEKVSYYERNYDRIDVTNELGRPYIYFLFYNQVNPLEYVNIRHADRDWNGLWTVYSFGKYDFSDQSKQPGERVLYLLTAGQLSRDKVIDRVTAPDGKVVFELGEQ